MKDIKAVKITDRFASIDHPIILDENTRTRRIFQPQLSKDSDGNWNVRGTIIVERKSNTGWLPLESNQLSNLQAGELLKLELKTEQLRKLFSGLTALMQIAEQYDAMKAPQELVVARKNEVVKVDSQAHLDIIQSLISENQSEKFWESMRSMQPDLATHLAGAELLRRRKDALNVFQNELIDNNWDEPGWEKFFLQNQWIFGYGLRYQLLRLLQNQANYGGADYTQKGGQKGEFLMNTEGEERFTVLVEIKRPDSLFFDSNSAKHPYRNGVPGFSTEFSNAISQVQVNTNRWEVEGSRRDRDRDLLSRAGIHTIAPRSILIYGNTNQLVDEDRRRSFELFRYNLRNPDIITFDELLDRAKFIVSETSNY